MGVFKNKFLVKLIAAICLVLTIFNFTGTTKVYAAESWGSVLLKPAIKLITAIADGIMDVLHKNINAQETSFITIEGTAANWWNKWGAKVIGVIVGIVIAAAVIVGICLIPGAVAGVGGTTHTAGGTTSGAGRTTGTTGGTTHTTGGTTGGASSTRGRTTAGKKGGLWRTIKGVSGAYARGLGKKALKRIKNGRPIRALARGAAGIFGGTLLGATGLALGIASGDPSKAFQYTTAGLAGGYSAGKGIAGSITDTLSVDSNEIGKEAQMSWYGDEYKGQIFTQQEEDDLMSEGNINYLRTIFGFSRGEAKDFLDSTGRECYKSGVRDVEDMAAIREVSGSIPIDEAIAATKLKNNLPQKIKNMSEKKLSEYRDTYAANFAERLRRMYPSMKDADITAEAEKYADNTIRYMKDLDKAKSSLTQI